MQSETQAIEWPHGVWRHPAGEARPAAPRALAAAFLAGVLTATALGAIGVALSFERLGLRASAVSGRAVPELPREWRWQREAIRFDHMYRAG